MGHLEPFTVMHLFVVLSTISDRFKFCLKLLFIMFCFCFESKGSSSVTNSKFEESYGAICCIVTIEIIYHSKGKKKQIPIIKRTFCR